MKILKVGSIDAYTLEHKMMSNTNKTRYHAVGKPDQFQQMLDTEIGKLDQKRNNDPKSKTREP